MDVIVYLIGSLLSGLVVGALGRLVIPGKDPMSIPMTILIGIAASFIAGLVWWAISGHERRRDHPLGRLRRADRLPDQPKPRGHADQPPADPPSACTGRSRRAW